MSGTSQQQVTIVLARLSASAEAALASAALPEGFGQRGYFRTRSKVEEDGYNAETHNVTMAVSSEYPVERWGGAEILSHGLNRIGLRSA